MWAYVGNTQEEVNKKLNLEKVYEVSDDGITTEAPDSSIYANRAESGPKALRTWKFFKIYEKVEDKFHDSKTFFAKDPTGEVFKIQKIGNFAQRIDCNHKFTEITIQDLYENYTEVKKPFGWIEVGSKVRIINEESSKYQFWGRVTNIEFDTMTLYEVTFKDMKKIHYLKQDLSREP